MLFFRALLWFLLLPGILSGVVPWLLLSLDPWRRGGWSAGFGLLAIGLAGLLWCVRDFYIAGKGTLAPWDPPKRLVVVGLYRATRNPMYLSILVLLVGWAVAFGSPLMLAYAIVVAVAFHLRVTRYEEPTLAKQFGAQWATYSQSTPRWLGWPKNRV